MSDSIIDEFVEFDLVSGSMLDSLCERAAERRDVNWGKNITYSRKVFVPLTNYCRDECGYCTFVKRPGDPGAKIMTPEEVMKVVNRGAELNAKEVLFSLGEKPEIRYESVRNELRSMGFSRLVDYLYTMCERVLSETNLLPHINAGTMNDEEFELLKPVCASMGMMLENTSRRLLKQGNAHYRCPDKTPIQRLRTLERAGKNNVPFTTGLLIGIGETWQERLETLKAIIEVHKRYGHIQEVIVQNFRAKPNTPMENSPEPSHDDMRRTLAVARLMLPIEISLQAPPNLSEKYLDYIDCGINDWGGISPLTADYINPECAWPQIESLQAEVNSKGYKLGERLTVYSRFIADPGRYLEPTIASRLDELIASQDYQSRSIP